MAQNGSGPGDVSRPRPVTIRWANDPAHRLWEVSLFLLRFLAWALSWIPAALLEGAATVLAIVAYHVLGLRRQVVHRNLAIALDSKVSPSERDRIARSSYRSFILTCFEFLRGTRLSWTDQVIFENEQYLLSGLAQERGVYVLAIHMGNWEAMAAAVTRYFKPAHVLVKSVGGVAMSRFVNEIRARNHFHVINRAAKLDGVRRIRQVLGRGEIVGFVMDQRRPGEPDVPLFGVPAKTNTGLASLWLKNQVPIVPGIAVREGFNRHRIVFFPPMRLPDLPYDKQNVITITAAINRQVEDMILHCPEQYFWLHNRWK